MKIAHQIAENAALEHHASYLKHEHQLSNSEEGILLWLEHESFYFSFAAWPQR